MMYVIGELISINFIKKIIHIDNLIHLIIDKLYKV